MDAIFDFVRTSFTPEQLCTVPAELAMQLRIPDRSKQYLLIVGLPRELDFFGGSVLRFNLLDRLPTLRQLFPEHTDRIDRGWDECRFLGLDEGTGYVLNQAECGSIWSVAIDSPGSEFVNSRVELFGWFLAEYTRVGKPSPSPDYNPLKAIDEMEQRMMSMDAAAMADDAPFWPMIIEDARLYAS